MTDGAIVTDPVLRRYVREPDLIVVLRPVPDARGRLDPGEQLTAQHRQPDPFVRIEQEIAEPGLFRCGA